MKLKCLFHAVALSLACAVAAPCALPQAMPAIGQSAPALTFTQLYGAPEGTKTDWPALRGKVVVLEFWATWCAPCIAEIPHLNELAQSLSSNHVQFIAVDDEEPGVIKEFLAKKPMEGWVGVGQKTFDDYGVEARPTTIVIDPQGRIAARLRPELVEKDQLLALAEGKPVTFAADNLPPALSADQKKSMMDAVAAMKNPATDPAGKPLFEISIRAGDPAGVTMMTMGSGSDTNQAEYDMRNAPLGILIPWAAGVPGDRVTVHGDAAKGHYNLHVSSPDLDIKQLAPLLESAVASAAAVKLTRVTAEENVYVIEATPQARAKLTLTVSNHGNMCYFDMRSGNLMMVKTSLDNLAPALEQALKVPVVNEAGIAGEFDASFALPKDSFDTAKAALESNLGLTLVKARRTVDRIVVDPIAAASKPEPTAPGKPADTSGPAIQVMAVPRSQ